MSYVAQLDSQHGYVNTDKHEPALRLLATEVERLRGENSWHRKRSTLVDAILDRLDETNPATVQAIHHALDCWDAVHPCPWVSP